MSVDDGFNVALQFFALGILWLFIIQFVMAIIGWMVDLLG